MSVFIALYRSINVGGWHSVKMEALRAMHEGLGHAKVQSYVQSGMSSSRRREPHSSANVVAIRRATGEPQMAFEGAAPAEAVAHSVGAGRWPAARSFLR